MSPNYNSIKIISIATIVLSLIACNNKPNTHQLKINSESLKVAIPNNQVNLKSQPPAKVETLNFTVPAKYQAKTVYQVAPSNKEKVIALTIDDGPWPKTTAKMLDILKQNHVKATFFWVGTALQENPEIGKRVVAEGHAIGNHTWHHWYRKMDQATAKSEIEKTNELIYQTTGVKTSFFRPPGGYLNNGLAAYAKSQKNSVVMWSVTSADTDPRAKYQVFVKNVIRDAKPGAIVLMHDGGGNRERTVKALPEIISGLKQQGYRFVTVPELLEMQQ
ncbi:MULTISPECIES: polysaccharide deacetylase family protein [Nostocales]|jgi:peptidoglycan/xylan/chitin deacetylase (PgdA/CDA1 family)|uniref:Polysaccharide deacetylase family protein n=2 Tax=Aphanizomenonaceae TaxID=1892259 RepID=A0ACC7S5K6_DOLFA|nr:MULTISPECIES: polysaccharide deacetylase family protein [Nostocales]MBD2279009.1 polysaccharide deacetylase family protein [Aphanizomenon flos-aquae FACHB-1040]MBO1067658.1 polysaccharide deacetylase family protein [Anabaena sp. 54]MBO1070903.1 polysaccharide deacetylase family protein [Dolichospermum sp. DEX189]MTJ43649.1 polysaccharide deacetylase family protein [Dolichospermum flos-aquae UHCC 0037]